MVASYLTIWFQEPRNCKYKAGGVMMRKCKNNSYSFLLASVLYVPVPNWSRWWQRWSSKWANWIETPRAGTNQGVKQESTLVQAASAVGVTSWSQALWEPDSLSELWQKQNMREYYFNISWCLSWDLTICNAVFGAQTLSRAWLFWTTTATQLVHASFLGKSLQSFLKC